MTRPGIKNNRHFTRFLFFSCRFWFCLTCLLSLMWKPNWHLLYIFHSIDFNIIMQKNGWEVILSTSPFSTYPLNTGLYISKNYILCLQYLVYRFESILHIMNHGLWFSTKIKVIIFQSDSLHVFVCVFMDNHTFYIHSWISSSHLHAFDLIFLIYHGGRAFKVSPNREKHKKSAVTQKNWKLRI